MVGIAGHYILMFVEKILNKNDKVMIQTEDHEVETEMTGEEIDQLIYERNTMSYHEGEWTELLRTAERERDEYQRQAERYEQHNGQALRLA